MESKQRKKEANHTEIQVIVTVNAIYFWVILSERHKNKVKFYMIKKLREEVPFLGRVS
jgi:hypothetical protein